jgi:uncharacterized protein YbaR (Trm112 family)
MALVLCPECGEETLDQMVSCPVCDKPLAAEQHRDRAKTARLGFFGAVFLGGVLSATFCNMAGYTGFSMGLAIAGIAGLILFLINLTAER